MELAVAGDMRCIGVRDDGKACMRAARARTHAALLVWITVVLLAVSFAGWAVRPRFRTGARHSERGLVVPTGVSGFPLSPFPAVLGWHVHCRCACGHVQSTQP